MYLTHRAVNAYTHILIILSLLPLLRSTSLKRGHPTRVTVVGSIAHTMHRIAQKPPKPSQTVIEYFDDRNTYDGLRRYGDSKFVINAFVRRLASVVPSSEVIVNNFCPGVVATGIDRDLPVWLRGIMFLIRKAVARTVEVGGRTVIHGRGILWILANALIFEILASDSYIHLVPRAWRVSLPEATETLTYKITILSKYHLNWAYYYYYFRPITSRQSFLHSLHL